MQMPRRQALVVGGSMAGLLAARVLSDFCEQVTIVDRDHFPQGSEHRKGVPQGKHAHALLAGGLQVIENMFPGLSAELTHRGAVSADAAADGHWFMEGGCLSKSLSGLTALFMTRPLIETCVRERVLGISKIRTLQTPGVEGLTMTSDNQRVTGVRTASATLEADLVVDASGRGSQTPQWLSSMGYSRPTEERIDVGLGYTTRFFRRDPSDMPFKFALIPPTPEGKCGGVILPQEGNRWIVTLLGYLGKYAPEDLDGFIEYARRLPAPYIYEVIRRTAPIGEAVPFRFPSSVRRHYERLSRFPEGYLVVGDALCSFNPIYGQGMTVAALQADQLRRVLRDEGIQDTARRFFVCAAKVIDNAWGISVGGDLKMPEIVGPRTFSVKVINWYLGKLHKAAHTDPLATLAFVRVAQLVDPPQAILKPRVAWRVLRH